MACAAVFLHPDLVPREDRQTFLVCELHMGRAGDPGDARPGRTHRGFLWLLQLRNADRGEGGKALLQPGRNPRRGRGARDWYKDVVFT